MAATFSALTDEERALFEYTKGLVLHEASQIAQGLKPTASFAILRVEHRGVDRAVFAAIVHDEDLGFLVKPIALMLDGVLFAEIQSNAPGGEPIDVL